LVEDPAEVLLGLADPLADHRREIDLVELEAELGRDHRRRERLAGARRAGEQQAQALAAGQLAIEAPAVEHRAAVARVVAQLAQPLYAVAGQDEVVPCRARGDLAREAPEPLAGLSA